MVRLTKHNARKPVIADGRCWPVTGYDQENRCPTFGMEIAPPHYQEGHSYRIDLSPDEMLALVKEWMREASATMTLNLKPKESR